MNDVKQKGQLHFEDFTFEIKFKFTSSRNDAVHLKIISLNLQMGKTRLNFGKAPALLNFIAWLFNVNSTFNNPLFRTCSHSIPLS